MAHSLVYEIAGGKKKNVFGGAGCIEFGFYILYPFIYLFIFFISLV
jgi:hypothetical protein